MKGVTFVTDEGNNRVDVQTDLKILEKFDHDLENLIDCIIAESGKNEERKPLKEVIKSLRRQGRLND